MVLKTKINTILYHTAGLPLPQYATRFLSNLNLSPDSRVVFKVDTSLLHTSRRSDLNLNFRERQAHIFEAILRQAQAIRESAGIQVKVKMLSGDRIDMVIDTAFDIDASLVVMDAQDIIESPLFPISSSLQKVFNFTQHPFLLIRPPAKTQQILFITDGETVAKKALDFLIRLPLPKLPNVTVLFTRSLLVFLVASYKIPHQAKSNNNRRN